MQKLLTEMIMEVIGSLIHNWFPLSLAIFIVAIMTVYIEPEKLKQVLLRKNNVSILASVAVGAFTPLCACGTMAVIIGMLTTTLPWGPVMAFLTSSPLMSPNGFIMLAGIINLKFAIALTIASIVIGLGSGYLTTLIEKKTDFLKNQVRFSKKPQIQTCTCADTVPIPEQVCSDVQLCCAVPTGYNINQSTLTSTFAQVPTMNIDTNILKILVFYSFFVAIGFLINYFVPTSIIVALFSAKNIFAVPLASLIGLPIYVSTESSIPLIKALMVGGASDGAMLAFMITGAGTSAWVVAGIATFLKTRIISLYVLLLLVGGILLGYLYDLLLATGI